MDYRSPHLRESLEARLGGPVDRPPRLVDDLNAFPLGQVATIRGLDSRLHQLCMLALWLADDQQIHVESFHRDVIEGGIDPERWQRGAVLIPSMEDDLPRYTVSTLLGALGAREGEPDLRMKVSLDPWNHAGAPVVVRPDMTYDMEAPPGADRLPFETRSKLLERIPGDVAVAVRRWMASAYGWWIECEDPALLLAPVESVVPRVFEVVTLSSDFAIAISGLHRELQAFGPPEDHERHGFRGPDTWFGPG